MAAPGYQTAGLEGTVTWGSSSTTDWHYNLIASLTSTMNAQLAVVGGDQDTTSMDSGGYHTSRNLLKSWTVRGSGYWKKSTPQLGIGALVTFASFYSYSGSTPANIILHGDEWTLNMAWDAIPINEFAASGGTPLVWEKFRPAYRGRFSGSLGGNVDSANALSMPHDWSSASTALKLYLNQNATIANSESFAGNARVNNFNLNLPFGAGNLQRWSANYVIDGSLTASSGTNAPGANIIPCNTGGSAPYTNVLTYPTYAATEPTADKTLTLTQASGRTVSGAAFLKSITIEAKTRELVKVNWEAQGSGTLTPG